MTTSLINAVEKEELTTGVNDNTTSSNPLLNHLHEETAPGEEGINCTGDTVIGTHTDGKILAVGEGKSYTEGMIVLTTPDGIAFTDYTTEATSSTGSTFSTFGGVGVNAAFYLGSDVPINGMVLKTATLVDPGIGTVAREYWNGSAWAVFTGMATADVAPHTQRADDIGTVVGAENVRFGSVDDQAQTNVDGNTKYWVRFRIAAELNSNGTTEQIKLHPNGYKVSANGFTEYFGDSIYPTELLMHWGLSEELSGTSPLNETIVFADNISLVYLNNRLRDGFTTGRGGYVKIPEGLDTSKGITGEVLFKVLTNNAGDILLRADTHQSKVGDPLTAANVSVTQQAATPIVGSSQDDLYRAPFTVDAQNLLPGEFLAFGIKRVGGDILDTFVGDIAIIDLRATGRSWKP